MTVVGRGLDLVLALIGATAWSLTAFFLVSRFVSPTAGGLLALGSVPVRSRLRDQRASAGRAQPQPLCRTLPALQAHDHVRAPAPALGAGPAHVVVALDVMGVRLMRVQPQRDLGLRDLPGGRLASTVRRCPRECEAPSTIGCRHGCDTLIESHRRGVAQLGQSAWFGTKRPAVRIRAPRPSEARSIHPTLQRVIYISRRIVGRREADGRGGLIGLLEIRRRKVQFALIALVVTLISYLVLMINGLGVGLNELAGSALKSWDADAIAYSDQSGLSVIRSELSDEAVQRIGSSQNVEEWAALGYVAANYRDADGVINSAAFIGYDPGTIGEPTVTDGRVLVAGEGNQLLADKSFLKAAGLKIGDRVEVSQRLTQREFTIAGEIDEGAFFFQPAVYVLRSTWQEMKYGSSTGVPSASIVLLKGDRLPGTESAGFEVVDKTTAFANIEGVSGQQSTVTALRWFGYIIGALVIGVFFYVLTIQKVPQIGVLKAIGASDVYVFSSSWSR